MKPNPFDATYVFRVTLDHIERSINISIQKTVGRMSDFSEDPEGTKEILLALTYLNTLLKLVNEIRTENAELLGESK